MRPGVEIALAGDVDFEPAVAGEQIEHVIEEAHAGAPLALAEPVQAQRDADVGLLRLASDLGAAAHGRSFSRTRTSIDLAWRTKPSACAMADPARASSASPFPSAASRTSAMRRRKWRGRSPHAERAPPPPGR